MQSPDITPTLIPLGKDIKTIFDEQLQLHDRHPIEVVGDYLPTVAMLETITDSTYYTRAQDDTENMPWVQKHPSGNTGPTNRQEGRRARLIYGFSLRKPQPEAVAAIDILKKNKVFPNWNLRAINGVLSDAVAYQKYKQQKEGKKAHPTDAEASSSIESTIGDLLHDAILLSQMRLAGWQQLRELRNGYLDSGDLTIVVNITRESDLTKHVYEKLMQNPDKGRLLNEPINLVLT